MKRKRNFLDPERGLSGDKKSFNGYCAILPSQTFRTAINSITDGFAVFDSEWRVCYVNKEAERIAGLNLEQMLHRNIWEVLPQYVNTRIFNKYHEAMATQQSLIFTEYLPHFDSWFDSILYPSEEGLTVLFRDVTNRVKNEQLLEQAIKKMGDLAQELQRSNDDLKEFAAVASHDIREPLRAISVSLEFLNRNGDLSLSERGRTYFDAILKSVARLGSLTDDLLNYSRVDSNDDNIEKFNLREALDIALENLRQPIEFSSIQLEIGPLPFIKGHKLQIARVFQNLIANSIKFRSEKPLKISIRTELLDSQQNQINLIVEDNGIGFEQSQAKNIFKMFYRISNASSSVSGSGIGLATCAKIIQRHGGSISAESEPQKGTRIRISFPSVR